MVRRAKTILDVSIQKRRVRQATYIVAGEERLWIIITVHKNLRESIV